MKRVIGSLLLIFILMISLCGIVWRTHTSSHVAPDCPAVQASSKVVHSQHWDGTMRVIIQSLNSSVASTADIYLYKFATASKSEYMSQNVSNSFPAYYFELEPHVLIYRVTNECGSYQKGIRLVW